MKPSDGGCHGRSCAWTLAVKKLLSWFCWHPTFTATTVSPSAWAPPPPAPLPTTSITTAIKFRTVLWFFVVLVTVSKSLSDKLYLSGVRENSLIFGFIWGGLLSLVEKAMAPHSSTLAWKIPWTGEPGGLPSLGLYRVGHNWSDLAAAAVSLEHEAFPSQEHVLCAVLSRFSHVQLFAILWTVARQAPLSMRFSRQEYWSGLPCPPPGDLLDPGMEPMSLTFPALASVFFTTSTTWEAL